MTNDAAFSRLVDVRNLPADGLDVFVETDAAANESRLVVIQPDGSGRTVLHSEPADFRMGAPRWIPGR